MESMEIDDSLYSRQRYVLGDDAMRRMAASRVFLHGVGGVGVEIAKNLCLAGVKGLTIQDDRVAKSQDLNTNFFIRAGDVDAGKSRSEACLHRLTELNPYVKVERVSGDLDDADDLSILEDFQCVILTDYTLDLLSRCDRFCRERNIRLIACEVFGVFGCLFCDFGPAHEVRDHNGEEPKRVMVSRISQAAPGVVTTLDEALHDLETGDVVTFKEVRGMDGLNGSQHPITVLSPTSFSIGDTSGLSAHESGGLAVEVKVPRKVAHRSLEEELRSPTMDAPDLGRLEAPSELHLAHLTLLHLGLKTRQEKTAFLARDGLPADRVHETATQVNADFGVMEPDRADLALVARLIASAGGGASLAPLCAFYGGVAAQEALKAVTGKFLPLRQWLYLDARDLLPAETLVNGTGAAPDRPWSPRHESSRRCLGDDLLQRLMAQKLFLVGCGAIGCELLKNFALLSVGTAEAGGEIVITDNDIIERSNLNRQFLFRDHHIREFKSKVAQGAVLDINPGLRVRPLTDKVCGATETTLFSDAFFESRTVCVNALDNVPTRLYMDGRCVAAQRPLLESGTMGTKGHVQVIVPHLTETYASQADPPEREFPYCTLKSFPASIEHCIQWARDKFESQFVQKPQMLHKFVETEGVHGPDQLRRLARRLAEGEHVERSVQVSRYLRTKCADWTECVRGARTKFSKYFNHKALQLLHSYPLDSRLSDGTFFWQSPKRPPTPLTFDPDNETHVNFVRSCARLLADVSGILYSSDMLTTPALMAEIKEYTPRAFVPSSKHIETDETVTREIAEERRSVAATAEAADADTVAVAVFDSLAGRQSTTTVMTAHPLPFEKDEDDNAHVDFVTAASNLRAAMYSLEQADRFRVKRIAGQIVPAIATTTAAVAGLVTVELVRLVAAGRASSDSADRYRNAFLNLALPVVLLSEPGECQRFPLPGGKSHTVWDRWEVRVPRATTVAAFLDIIQSRYSVQPSSVMQGSKIVYLPFLPNHHKRLKKPILEFLRFTPEKPYVDLLVTTEKDFPGGEINAAQSQTDDDDSENEEPTVGCPTVRLYIQ